MSRLFLNVTSLSNKCRIFISIAFLLLVQVNLAAESTKEEVKIGLIFPLSGPMASFGEDMALALPLLEDSFNKQQSQYQFKLIIEDGKFGQTNAAITAAKKLVEIDHVNFMIVGSSGELLQTTPFLEANKILTVGGFASHPDISKSGDYIFRTYVNSEQGIRLIKDKFSQVGIKNFAIVTEEASFTMAVKDTLLKYLKEKVVYSEEFKLGESDYNTILIKARAKSPEAFYLNASTPAAFIGLIKQIKTLKITQPIFTFYAPSQQEVQESLGKDLEGVYYLDFPEVKDTSKDYLNFVAAFEKLKGGKINSPFNMRTNYNAVQVVFNSIIKVGANADKVKNYLYSYDEPSATGRLKFDHNGDVKDLDLVLKPYKLAR